MKSIYTAVSVSYLDNKFDCGFVYVSMSNLRNGSDIVLQSRAIKDYAEAMQELRKAERVTGKAAEMEYRVMNYKNTGLFSCVDKVVRTYQSWDD